MKSKTEKEYFCLNNLKKNTTRYIFYKIVIIKLLKINTLKQMLKIVKNIVTGVTFPLIRKKKRSKKGSFYKLPQSHENN